MKRGLVVTVAVAAFGAAALSGWIYASSPGRSVESDAQSSERSGGQQDALLAARTKGSIDAPMTMFEVGDFQCPACRIFFTETLPRLQEEYISTGKLKLVFINFPIPQSHPNAPAAHEFAMCAAHQDKFWPVHDLLYENQDAWAPLPDPATYFMGLADSAGVERGELQRCLESGTVRSLVGAEARMAFDAGVTSTPSLILEGGVIRGAAPIEALRPILDSIFLARTEEP